MPTKIIEVLVTGVVGPRPFPIRILIIGLSIVGCFGLVIGASIFVNSQSQQQQYDQAIANADATATAIAENDATSVNAVATATEISAQQLIASLLSTTNIDNVQLLTNNLIQFRLSNQGEKTVELAMYGCQGWGLAFDGGGLAPGKNLTVNCDYGNYTNVKTPEAFYFVARIYLTAYELYSWKIFPYTGTNGISKFCFIHSVKGINVCP